MASRTLEIVLKVLGAGAASGAFAGVSGSAKAMGDDVQKAGADTGKGLDAAASKAEALKGKLESVRNAGVAIGAAGIGALALGNSLAVSFLEADRLNGKLESLLAAKGLSGASDSVKKLGNEIAGLTGGDDDAIAAAIGQAIATGRTRGLAEYGILIDANGKAAIEAAGKISAQAASQETLNQVMRAGASAVATLGANLDPATASLGQFNVRWGNLEEGIGQGAARAKAAILGGLLGPVMSLLETSPGLQTFAGGFIEIGGAVLTGAGSLISFAAQMVIAFTQMAAFTAAKTAQATATAAEALAADAEAVSITAAGTASAVAGTAAAGAAVGFGALAISVGLAALPFIAIAVAAAAAMKGIDWILNHNEDAALQENIAKGDSAEAESKAIFDKMRGGSANPATAAATIPIAPVAMPIAPSAMPAASAVAAAVASGGNAFAPTVQARRGSGNAAQGGLGIGEQIALSLIGGAQPGGPVTAASGFAGKGGIARVGDKVNGGILQANGKISQGGGGELRVKFDDLIFPNQGVGTLAGGY